jgi:hypothetical protein
MREWKRIEEAPPNYTEVILAVWCKITDDWSIGEGYFSAHDGKWWWANQSSDDYHAKSVNPNFWMPLPEPPKP